MNIGSYITVTTKKLNSKLLAALNNLQYTKEAKQEAATTQQQALKAYLSASTQLICLKKVYKKVQSKKYRLVEQGLYKLKANKQKKLNNLKAELLSTLIAY